MFSHSNEKEVNEDEILKKMTLNKKLGQRGLRRVVEVLGLSVK